MLAIKWKKALIAAEDAGLITNSQYGGRKHMLSQDPAYIKMAQMEIARLTRTNYGQINYDARACYNRILPNIAPMVSRIHGIPNSIIKIHHNLLKDITYNVQVEGLTVTYQKVQYTTQDKEAATAPLYGFSSPM
jgi:hypothetical protein